MAVNHKYEQSEASTGDACIRCGRPQAVHCIHDRDGRDCSPEECGGTRLDPCGYTVEQWRRLEAGAPKDLAHVWVYPSPGWAGRHCQVCRFRKSDLVGLHCFGSSSLYDSVYQVGHSAGRAFERTRLREILGL